MRRLAVTLIVATALAVMAVGSATGRGTLTVTPDPVVLGSTFTIDAGCGYAVGTALSFEVTGPRKSNIHYFTADEPVGDDGCFIDPWLAWWGVAGEYQLTAWQRDTHGSTRKVAVAKFTVVA